MDRDIVEQLRDETSISDAPWAERLEVCKTAATEIERLRYALREFRSLVKEGGVPRYTVTPGAALNSVIEETVDPIMRRFPSY